jgi:hypothetical protein
MLYLGGAFPAEWRDNFFFHDVHMNRLRCETLTRNGSGYLGARKTDFLTSPDEWFRGLSPQYGPDGGIFISDWYDKVPCHQQRAYTDRSNGRIYKLVTDQVKPRRVDLTAASDLELVNLQLDPNDWFVRHARRLRQRLRWRKSCLKTRTIRANSARCGCCILKARSRMSVRCELSPPNPSLSAAGP